jgi:hypothetical protein
MAEAIDFPGSNKVFAAPPGREDVSDLHTFVNGKAIVSAWKLSPEELADIQRTGTVFISLLSGMTLFPVYVGSEDSVRRLVADYGKVWDRPAEPHGPKCFVPTCHHRGTDWPEIHFWSVERTDCPPPYRLEIPRAICTVHQSQFDPQVYFTETAKAGMRDMIVSGGAAEPDYQRLVVVWKPIDDPVFVELQDTGQARLIWG